MSGTDNDNINVKLSAGEILGYGGGKSGYPDGVDFTISDTSIAKPSFANPKRWNEDGIYLTCAI